MEQAPFLKEERKLIDTIADRLGHFTFPAAAAAGGDGVGQRPPRAWPRGAQEVGDHPRAAGPHRPAPVGPDHPQDGQPPGWSGIEEARRLLADVRPAARRRPRRGAGEANRPSRETDLSLDDVLLAAKSSTVASRHLSGDEILEPIQKWIREDRVGFLVQALENLRHVAWARSPTRLRRYHHLVPRRTSSSRRVHARTVARLADPPPPHRPARLHQRSPRTTSTSRTSSSCSSA